jgi:carbamoylphosphate synthase large subunit
MPKRTDIGSILIIGAGPIVIGQACEFDDSGVQACKALRAEGYRIILVNSNPATIMTDPDIADATYIEPITAAMLEQIIAKERPHALLPTMGGQTALNVSLELERRGVLQKYVVEMIGARAEVIDKAEDRQKFRDAMDKIGLESPKSQVAHSLEEAIAAQALVGLPAIIRPSFTLAGTGGGIAYNLEEFREIVERGLDLSPTHEVLIEESVLGWKEFELEVVRDKADNCIIVCSIENIDPMGVHTGDSITVAPALTLTDKEYQRMRTAAIAVLREVGVETGGSNVQFAVNPADGRMVVIEMNPRVSRSLPDRQDRRAPGGRLHPRRTDERDHRGDARLVRTHDRLRGNQDPALRVREISGFGTLPDHLDEVGRRGDGDRAHVRREPAEGAARAGDRAFRPGRDRHPRRRRPGHGPHRHHPRAGRADAGPVAGDRPGVPPGAERGGSQRRLRLRALVPAPDRAPGHHRGAPARRRPAFRRGGDAAVESAGLL